LPPEERREIMQLVDALWSAKRRPGVSTGG
jgi:hypothetical protein